MVKYFIALEPEKRVYDEILKQKRIIGDLNDSQAYLSHPPHTTLMPLNLGNHNNPNNHDEKIIINKLGLFAAQTNKIASEISGLHVFYDDAAAGGGHTIVYNFSDESANALRKMQLLIINLLSMGDEMKFFSADSPVFAKLGGLEKQNILKYGFPYIGSNWIPHLTLASIDKEGFDEIYSIVSKQNLKGEFAFDSIVLYKEAGEPEVVKKFALKNA